MALHDSTTKNAPVKGRRSWHLRRAAVCAKVLMSSKRVSSFHISPRNTRPTALSGIQTTGVRPYRAYCGLSQAQGGHKVQHPDGPRVTDEQRLAELYPRTQVIEAESDRPMSDGNARGNGALMPKGRAACCLPLTPSVLW